MLRLLNKMKSNMLEKLHSQVYERHNGAFSDKVTPDIDASTDDQVVQYDIHVVKNTFIVDLKQIIGIYDKQIKMIANKF